MTLALPPERARESHDDSDSPERNQKQSKRRRVMGGAVAVVALGSSAAIFVLRGGDSSEETAPQERTEEAASAPNPDNAGDMVIDETGELEFSIDELIASGEAVEYQNEFGERIVLQLDDRWSASQIRTIEEIALSPQSPVTDEQVASLLGGLGFSEQVRAEISAYDPVVNQSSAEDNRYLSLMTLGIVPFVEGYRGYDVAIDADGNGYFVDRINPANRYSASGESYTVPEDEASLLPDQVAALLQGEASTQNDSSNNSLEETTETTPEANLLYSAELDPNNVAAVEQLVTEINDLRTAAVVAGDEEMLASLYVDGVSGGQYANDMRSIEQFQFDLEWFADELASGEKTVKDVYNAGGFKLEPSTLFIESINSDTSFQAEYVLRRTYDDIGFRVEETYVFDSEAQQWKIAGNEEYDAIGSLD